MLPTIPPGLTRPSIAFVFVNAVSAAYHLPAVHNAARASGPVHAALHLLQIVAGITGWWRVLGVLPEAPPLPYPSRMLYLVLRALPQGILGAVFTVARGALFTRYVDASRLWPSLSA